MSSADLSFDSLAGENTEKILPDAPVVRIRLQPEERWIELPRHKVKNVRRLLETLGLPPCTALVARGRELLTPDRPVLPGDSLLVRKVTSSG